MGYLISKLWTNIFSKKAVRVLLLGLDGSGKTTILYNLKMGEVVKTIPTIEYNVETLEYKRLKFIVFDVCGQKKFRILWKHYYQNVNAIIFVIDSTDEERIEEAAEEIHRLLFQDELRDCVLLVIANKQDLNSAMSPNEIAKKLRLEGVRRSWIVQGTSATTGQGLKEGLDWLALEMQKKV